MNYEYLISVTGMITSISPFNNDCCSQFVSIRTEEQELHLILSPETMVVDSMRLLPGMRIAAFYDSMAPVPLIYPPQYRALLVTTLRAEEDITLKYFDENLTASDGSLKLNIYPSTFISTQNGQTYSCSLGNHYLMVYYVNTTRSIPAQTSPTRVIVMCQASSQAPQPSPMADNTRVPQFTQTPVNPQRPQASLIPQTENPQIPQFNQMPITTQTPQPPVMPQTSQMTADTQETPFRQASDNTSLMNQPAQMADNIQTPMDPGMPQPPQMPQQPQSFWQPQMPHPVFQIYQPFCQC